jgi:hypothetical protein
MTDRAWATLILIIILLGSIILNVWQANKLRDYEDRPYTDSFDHGFPRKAAQLWSQKSHEPFQEVISSRYPKVIYFDQNACVELSFRRTTFGGSPVYCFDQNTAKLIARYDNVE